jgi:hypothetical protein
MERDSHRGAEFQILEKIEGLSFLKRQSGSPQKYILIYQY